MSIDEQIREHLHLVREVAAEAALKGHRYDDAYADGLLGLWQAVQTFTGGNFDGCAATIMRRRILDGWRKEHGRRGNRPRNVELFDQPETDDPIQDLIDAMDDATTVLQMLATIPKQKPRAQQVIRGRLDGRTFTAIAADLHISGRYAGLLWGSWVASQRAV